MVPAATQPPVPQRQWLGGKAGVLSSDAVVNREIDGDVPNPDHGSSDDERARRHPLGRSRKGYLQGPDSPPEGEKDRQRSVPATRQRTSTIERPGPGIPCSPARQALLCSLQD